MHYTKIHFKDYAADTAHLTLLEHGVYFQMMRLYYTNEKPLPIDPTKIARFIGVRSEDELFAVQNILDEFFTKHGDGWHQKRIDAEIAAYQEKAEKNRKNGGMGGRPKANGNPEETQTVSNTNPEETLTTNHKPLTTKNQKNTGANAPDGFLKFWDAWPTSPRKVAKAACLKKWTALNLEPLTDSILSHVAAARLTKQWRDGFEPAPLTYLNQRRWEDGAPQERQAEKVFVI